MFWQRQRNTSFKRKYRLTYLELQAITVFAIKQFWRTFSILITLDLRLYQTYLSTMAVIFFKKVSVNYYLTTKILFFFFLPSDKVIYGKFNRKRKYVKKQRRDLSFYFTRPRKYIVNANVSCFRTVFFMNFYANRGRLYYITKKICWSYTHTKKYMTWVD